MKEFFLNNKQKIIRILEWTGVVIFILLAIFMVFAGIMAILRTDMDSFDMNKYVTVHYSGFDGKGVAELNFDKAAFQEDLEVSYAKYEAGLFPITKEYTLDDYIDFSQSFETVAKDAENLNNGDEIKVIITYDEDLADKLNKRIENVEMTAKVSGLEHGHKLSEKELFKDLKFTVEGISPALKVDFENQSKDDFVSKVSYSIKDAKDSYKNGDVLTVEAVFDPSLAVANNIDTGDSAYSKTYQIDGFKSYVTDIDQVPQEILDRAIEEGKNLFGDANDYGLRIITEAGLYPDFSKGYEFSNPQILSAYLEVLTDPSQEGATKPFNYLELCYEVHLGQPGGRVGCSAEAIVCFNNLIIDENGNCIFDESTGKLFSASHNDSSIKKSINEWFGSDYELKKFSISQ